MGLSQEDREYLSELWEWASGEKTSPGDWNDEAAKLLLDMYREVTRCSKLIHIATAIPQNLPPDLWDIYNLYKSIKGLLDQHEIHKVYRDACLLRYRDMINMELLYK
jgi:hypothetical protein